MKMFICCPRDVPDISWAVFLVSPSHHVSVSCTLYLLPPSRWFRRCVVCPGSVWVRTRLTVHSGVCLAWPGLRATRARTDPRKSFFTSGSTRSYFKLPCVLSAVSTQAGSSDRFTFSWMVSRRTVWHAGDTLFKIWFNLSATVSECHPSQTTVTARPLNNTNWIWIIVIIVMTR